MKKVLINEYQNLIELQRFINKYLAMNLPSFNRDTELVVDYQEGNYLDWCICHLEAVKLEFNWATYDYLENNISMLKTVVKTVGEVLNEIDSLLSQLPKER